MFGFGAWELALVGAVVVLALFSGRTVAGMARQAGQMTGLWLKIKQKMSILKFFK